MASIGVCGKHKSTVLKPPGVRDRSALSLLKMGILSEDLRNFKRLSWTDGRSLGLVIGDFVFDAEGHRKATGRQIGHGLPVVGSGLTKVIEVRCGPPVSRSRVNKDRNVFSFLLREPKYLCTITVGVALSIEPVEVPAPVRANASSG